MLQNSAQRKENSVFELRALSLAQHSRTRLQLLYVQFHVVVREMALVLGVWSARRPGSVRPGVGRAAPGEADENREDGSNAEHDDDPGYHLVRAVVEALVQQVLVEVLAARFADPLRVHGAFPLLKLLQGLHDAQSSGSGSGSGCSGGWRPRHCRPLVERDTVPVPGHLVVTARTQWITQRDRCLTINKVSGGLFLTCGCPLSFHDSSCVRWQACHQNTSFKEMAFRFAVGQRHPISATQMLRSSSSEAK